MHDKLVGKANNIYTSTFVLKTKYYTDKSDLEKTISDISELVKKNGYNAKISKIENKIPSVSGLHTNVALTAVESKIPDVSSLVKKTGYNKKLREIEKKVANHKHGKYITTPELNKLTTENFAARLKQENVVTKTDFDSKLKTLNQ